MFWTHVLEIVVAILLAAFIQRTLIIIIQNIIDNYEREP